MTKSDKDLVIGASGGLGFIAVVVLVAALGACNKVEAAADDKAAATGIYNNSDTVPGLWSDPDTGCEYLTLYSHGITPRMEHTVNGDRQRGCR